MTPRYSGDGWELYVGDCLAILPGLTGVDAVVTDPPYGINYDASKSTQQGIQKFAMLVGDSRPFDMTPLLAFDDVIAWCLPHYTINVPVGVGAWYAWDKVKQNGLGVRIGECEYAWHMRGTKTRAFRHLWSGAYRDSESGESSKHPTQKPVALMEWCLSFLPNAETILDPFAGSGTTGIACIKTGRRFIGIEIDEHYAAIAAKRLARAEADVRNSLPFPEPEPRPKQAELWEAV